MNKSPDPFVQYVQALATSGNRAALSALRQGSANPLRALPYVAPFLKEDDGRQREESLLLLGALFGSFPETGSVSLATALRFVMERAQSDSIELRFRALLDSPREDLSNHLRHAVSLVRSAQIPIDYNDLLRAIRNWSHEDRFIQRAWARQFWSSHARSAEEKEQENP